MPHRAYVGLGANLGMARDTLARAMKSLSQARDVRAVRVSPLYRTAPIDATGPDFLNAVCVIETPLDAPSVLHILQSLEAEAGRERPYRNAPRTLDLDLLWHAAGPWHSPALTVPHPRLHQRAFVLRPLLDVEPDLVVPGLGVLSEWLERVADQPIERVAGPDWAVDSRGSSTPAAAGF